MKPQFGTRDRLPDGRIAGALTILHEAKTLGRCMVAYSGGKDGLVAAILAREAGVHVNVCELSFTFHQQETDIRLTARHLGLPVIYRKTLDLDWLAKRPQYVFNQPGRVNNEFMQARQRNSMEDFARANNYRVVITGRKRRTNTCAKDIEVRSTGTIGCHPLREWDDIDVWTFLRERGIPVPWVYSTPFGKHQGNTGWPFCKLGKDRQENYRIIHDIEPATVHEAAMAGVIGAREFLDGNRGIAALHA